MLRTDRTTGQWVEIEAYLTAQLLLCYQNLAKPGLEMATTEQYRGRAAFIKMLLGQQSQPLAAQD